MPARAAAQLTFDFAEPVLPWLAATVTAPEAAPAGTGSAPMNGAEVLGMGAMATMCGDGSFPYLYRRLVSAHWASRRADVGRGSADFAILTFEMFDGEVGIANVGADLRDLLTHMPKRLRKWDARHFDRDFFRNAWLSQGWDRMDGGPCAWRSGERRWVRCPEWRKAEAA